MILLFAVAGGTLAGIAAPEINTSLYEALTSMYKPPVVSNEITHKPTTPTNLKATAGDGQVSLTWDESPTASSYNVKRLVSDKKYAKIGSSNSTSYVDSTVTNGKSYSYVVSAINSVGESGNSQAGEATPDKGSGKSAPNSSSPTPSESATPVVYPQAHSAVGILPIAALGALIGAWLGNVVLLVLTGLVQRWNKMDEGDRLTTVIGVIAGIIVSLPFLALFQTMPIASTYIQWIVLALTFGSITLSLYVFQSISEFLPWNKNRGPLRRTGIKVLDTNVIIDGRIRDVAHNGFLEGNLYVPQFVVEELQHIADHHDPLKRQRGKRGLDVLRYMQSEMPLEVGTRDHLAPHTGDPVDSRLVRLARALGADLVTNDFNLNRVAALQDVRVLNINDLALALKPTVLPQEKLQIKIIRDGNQPGQGVGYLDDGTMVVVENGHDYLNQTVSVEVTQVIQTERGKMIFGEISSEEEPPQTDTQRRA